MFTIVAFLAGLGIAALVIAAIVSWLATTFPRARAFVAFLLTCAATYSLGFALDMAAQAFVGMLPTANAVMSIFTWLGIGAFFQALAFSVSPARWPLLIPHVINALLAALAGLAHPRHFFVAALVLLIGIVVFLAKPRHDIFHEATPSA